MAINKRLRFEILKRDGFKCKYCHGSEVLLTVDHVVPKALGGTDDPGNLVASCDDCNAGKTSTLPGGANVGDVDDDLIRWTRAMKRAAFLEREKQDEADRYRDAFKVEWDRWHPTSDKSPVPLPAEWGHALDQLHAASLPSWMWKQIVENAMRADVHVERFRYACDLAWKKVVSMRGTARIDASGQDVPGDWQEREAAAVVAAAAYVWQSAWMKAHQNYPTPEAAAAFRGCARLAFAESLDAADLMTAAGSAGQRAIQNLEEALFLAQIEDQDAHTTALTAQAVWCRLYELMNDAKPTAEQARKVFDAAWDMYYDPESARDILRAAEWAAHFQDSDGLDLVGAAIDAERNEIVLRAADAWDHGILTATGKWSSPDDHDDLCRAVEAALKAGANEGGVLFAASYAGYHASPTLYFGLNHKHVGYSDGLAAQPFEDLWKRAWKATVHDWPTGEELEAYRRSFKAATDGADLTVGDLYYAALTAATYQSADLQHGLTRRMSVFATASALSSIGGV